MDSSVFQSLFLRMRSQIMEALDAEVVAATPAPALAMEVRAAIDTLAEQENSRLPINVRTEFTRRLVDEITGLGPLQSLLDDPTISDIMVNGPDCIYVERNGRLERTDVTFIDNQQLLTIARRIAVDAGRKVDESTPMCDARLANGSRVNITVPPIALDGAVISIRKFSISAVGFKDLISYHSLSSAMARVLAIAAYCRLNILISGGTGSGKTTLLNALSGQISERERIITIEDAAELQLQQPHVVRLETRPSGTENNGAITARDLVINALRMRPDRIIVGECRGPEAFEMLQAMNTGHDGSMSTLHANTPRDALARMESMVMMAVPNLPVSVILRNIASAVDLVVQVSRLSDGSRKIMSICEVMGVEGENITLEELFAFEPEHHQHDELIGSFRCNGLLNHSVLTQKARFFGMESMLSAILQEQPPARKQAS